MAPTFNFGQIGRRGLGAEKLGCGKTHTSWEVDSPVLKCETFLHFSPRVISVGGWRAATYLKMWTNPADLSGLFTIHIPKAFMYLGTRASDLPVK